MAGLRAKVHFCRRYGTVTAALRYRYVTEFVIFSETGFSPLINRITLIRRIAAIRQYEFWNDSNGAAIF
jgi:hypothetical protein